jgi:hypothetical protein
MTKHIFVGQLGSQGKKHNTFSFVQELWSEVLIFLSKTENKHLGNIFILKYFKINNVTFGV